MGSHTPGSGVPALSETCIPPPSACYTTSIRHYRQPFPPAFEAITARKKAKQKMRGCFKERDHRRKRSSLMSNQPLNPDLHNEGLSPSEPVDWTPSQATLWTWCALCGHGGHTNCLSTWFADGSLSDGACATEGCLCDCVRGNRRDEKIQEVLRLKAEKDRSKPVRKGDDWKVHESRAVSAVRSALGDEPQSAQQPTGSRSGSRSRKEEPKRVRVVAPNPDLRASDPHLGPFPSAASKLPK